MIRLPHPTLIHVAAALCASLALAGCANTGTMTPQQREGVELRRYCEQHHEDIERCLGFLGWR